MIIKGKEYFYDNLNNKEYKILICDNKKKINEMINYINYFLKINYKKYLAIDFEFNNINNKREIALCQINLETNDNGKIYLFYPPDLNKNQLKIFKKILIDKHTIKILHGGESLDLPYLFNNILIDNNEKEMFLENLYDTRYLCEYYNIENNLEKKCKINYLLLNMNVITKKQFDFLQYEEEKMGPIYNIIIDVKNMNNLLILYTTTDVLYLPELLKKYPKNKLYQKLIPQLTNFVFYLKKVNDYNNIIENISKYNINFIKYDNKTIQLSNIYNIICYMIDYKNKIYYNFLDINHFKKTLEIILKYILYNLLVDNFNVWYNNSKLISDKIFLNLTFMKNNKELYNFFTKIKENIKEILN